MKAKQIRWTEHGNGQMFFGYVGPFRFVTLHKYINGYDMSSASIGGRDVFQKPVGQPLPATLDEAKAFCQSQLDSFIQSICEE